ncbi:MAG: electron transport complex subunit RsxA [Gammaproteobacteria bacterium]|nr:electron transport complex subunit RsxA [Gammaproteobacteria bacterium]
MTEILLILLGTVFVNNFVLTQFLGLCPFMGVSNKFTNTLSMSMATSFVLTLSSAAAYLVYNYILVPLQVEFIRTVVLIMVIASLVQLTEMAVRRLSPMMYRILGIFLPLITSNCAVLGVALLTINRIDSFVNAVFYGLGASLGFSLVLILFSAMRERIEMADVPKPLRGSAIGMISAGLISMVFMGFNGLIKF